MNGYVVSNCAGRRYRNRNSNVVTNNPNFQALLQIRVLNPRRCQDSRPTIRLLRIFAKSTEMYLALPRRRSHSAFDSGNDSGRRYLDSSRFVNTMRLLQFQIISAPEILLIKARATGFSFAERVDAARIRLFNASTCTSACSCLTATMSEWGKCRDANTD